MANLKTNGIDAITSYFSGGFQKANRFEVRIGGNEGVVFWATSVQIPQQDVTYYPENFSPSGPIIQVPLRRGYDDRFLVDFIVESNWAVRKYFETWMDSMFSSTSAAASRSRKVKVRNTTGNLRDIQIFALNDALKINSGAPNQGVNAKFTLFEAYPKLLLPSQFTNDATNQYLSLTVDFNYRYYTFTGIAGV